MILRPATPITESVARIDFTGDLLHARLNEKHELFRRLVKNRELRWDWGAGHWWRVVEGNSRPAADRAAELGHVLLAAGFVVEVPEDVAEMILAVSYRPEPRKRIAVVKTGEHEGWFAFIWPRDDDDYYAALRIPGARYVPRHVIAPPDQYEAVQDFAESHGYHIMSKAQKTIDETAARRLAALIIDVPPLPSNRAANPQDFTPGEVGIDPELADDDEPL